MKKGEIFIMKAHVIEQFGDESVFQTVEIPTPTIRPNEVLVEVKATSINPIELKIRSGFVPHLAPPKPSILNADVSGVVVEIGSNVTSLSVGDEVYGCAGGIGETQGALADYMACDVRLLAKKPTILSFEEAAALPLVSITAYEGLLDKARIQAGEKILVYGATGGVGHLALQMAKKQGLHVTAAVSSKEKGAIAKQLGADHLFYYKEESLETVVDDVTNGQGFDIVFDPVGDDHLQQSFQAVKPNGQVVTTSSRSTQDLSLMHGKALSLHVVFMLLPLLQNKHREHHHDILHTLSKWVEEGAITPVLDKQTFSFDTIAEAHRYVASKQAIGKVVLTQK